MDVYRVVKRIAPGGRLSLRNLPFQPGDRVEVIVRSQKDAGGDGEPYPLRGKPVHYLDPFESVDENEWEALR